MSSDPAPTTDGIVTIEVDLPQGLVEDFGPEEGSADPLALPKLVGGVLGHVGRTLATVATTSEENTDEDDAPQDEDE